MHLLLSLLAAAAAAIQPEPPPVPIPPLPDISPLAPVDPARPDLPSCPLPPDSPPAAIPGLAIGGIAFAPADVESADQGWDDIARPVVLLTLSESGRAKFAALQRSDCEGQVLEIRVDGELVSAPVLREPIEGPGIMIDGAFTAEQAEALAARLAGRRPSY
jgi:preprotein translocase subunit SecD